MTQYNRVNVKLSTSQLNKSKSAIKNENDAVIRLSLNVIGDSNDKVLVFVKHLLIIHLLILNFQKLNHQK